MWNAEFTKAEDTYLGLDISEDTDRATAEQRGCTIEYADDYTLQLDLDEWENIEIAQKSLNFLKGVYPALANSQIALRESASGNMHGIIKLSEPLPVETRIMLQALMGSDRWREAFALKRYKLGSDKPLLLFRPKPLETVWEEDDSDLPF